MNRKALFLDRDGVINVDSGYVHKIEDFQFLDGIFDICRLACAKGYIIVVITNQAGIGRGYYNVSDFNTLTKWMCKKFAAENISISKVYFSPCHPKHGLGHYKKNDYLRKPNPGMIVKAVEEFDLNLEASVLIGDKITDIKAGTSAGVGTNILLSASEDVIDEGAYFRAFDLYEAADYL